jgi:hypothetical protein
MIIRAPRVKPRTEAHSTQPGHIPALRQRYSMPAVFSQPRKSRSRLSPTR